VGLEHDPVGHVDTWPLVAVMGGRPGSLQTTLARAAEDAWKQHRRQCAQCSLATDRKRPGERCPTGRKLYGDMGAARRRLEQERAADAAPNPDQGAIF
jgi:hypothetical protein